MIHPLCFKFLCGLLVVSSLISCRDPSVPPLQKVTGQVLLDDVPLPAVKVTFTPVSGGKSSTCITNEDGYYMLQYTNVIAGAVAGEHVVTIEKESVTPDQQLPDSYHSASGLRVTVNRGSNPMDFHLKSDGSIPPEFEQQGTE